MFSLFHRRKLKYNKGQLTPFFIVILVVIIIMALVTVNLSKIATTRTEASNSADAAGLAAGSVMANVFNQIAQANSYQYVAYWMYYGLVSISFAIAIGQLIYAQVQATLAHGLASTAMGMACASPCAAKNLADQAILKLFSAVNTLDSFARVTIRAIIIQFIAYTAGSWIYYYLIIRPIADKGREKAIEAGHGFSFSNSGTGTKLKPGSMTSPEGGEDGNNYKDAFTDFLDSIDGTRDVETYTWTDGQARGHRVVSRIDIDPIEWYDLRVMVDPTPLTLIWLALCITWAATAMGTLVSAMAFYTTASGLLSTACTCQQTYYICQACCGPYSPGCCACAAAAWTCWWNACSAAITALGSGMMANTIGISEIMWIYPIVLLAWAGMLPGWIVPDDGSILPNPLVFSICWIEDVEHDRLVMAEADQYHSGANVGIWNIQYPDTHSFCEVNFRGNGKIFDGGNWDILHHDASIQRTDHLDGE